MQLHPRRMGVGEGGIGVPTPLHQGSAVHGRGAGVEKEGGTVEVQVVGQELCQGVVVGEGMSQGVVVGGGMQRICKGWRVLEGVYCLGMYCQVCTARYVLPGVVC